MKKESSLLKELYFWSFIAFGAISPFAGIFYKKVLIDTNGNPDIIKIGLIFSFAPIAGLLSNLITSIISDKINGGKHIISWLSIMTFASAILVGLSGSSFFMQLPLNIRFTALFSTVFLYRFTMMPINALIDTETMRHLNKIGKREQYGTYRFWGTIGWAVITPIMGAILLLTNNYQTIFFVGALGYLVLAYLGTKTAEGSKIEKQKIDWSILKKDWRFLLFLVFIFLTGMVDSSTATYMGFFFDDVMNTPLKIGLMFSIWTTFEIPVMHFSKQLISIFTSKGLMIFGLILGALKLYLFSRFTLETPFVFQLLAALIHGPAFAFLYLGAIDIVDNYVSDS